MERVEQIHNSATQWPTVSRDEIYKRYSFAIGPPLLLQFAKSISLGIPCYYNSLSLPHHQQKSHTSLFPATLHITEVRATLFPRIAPKSHGNSYYIISHDLVFLILVSSKTAKGLISTPKK